MDRHDAGPGIGTGDAADTWFQLRRKRFNQALKVLNITFLYSLIISVAAFVLLFFFPELVLKVFTGDGTLISTAANASRIIFITMPFFGFYNVGQMVFPSIGKALESFIIAITRPLVFVIPLTVILPTYYGLNGVWAAFPGADIFTLILILGLLIPLYRQFRKAIAMPQPQLDTGAPTV